MVHRCVDGPVLPRALEVAQELAAKAPKPLAHIKRLIRGTTGRPLDQGLAAERTLFCDLLVDPRSIELMHEMNAGQRDIRDRRGDGK